MSLTFDYSGKRIVQIFHFLPAGGVCAADQEGQVLWHGFFNVNRRNGYYRKADLQRVFRCCNLPEVCGCKRQFGGFKTCNGKIPASEPPQTPSFEAV